MKLLYLSAHRQMEADEVKTFHELGFEVFPVGFYTDEIKGKELCNIDLELLAEFKTKHPYFVPSTPIKLDRDFVRKFDIIFNVHFVENIELNWENIKDKIVIRRCIAQGDGPYEYRLNKHRKEGLKIVRVSKNEFSLPGFCGEDAVICGSVDPALYEPWIGDEEVVVTVRRQMKHHYIHTQYNVYNYVTHPFKRTLYGYHNEDIPWAISNADESLIKNSLRHARVAFSGCTRPAALTYTFQESMVAGCPTVTVGPKIGNFHNHISGQMYEQHEYLKSGENGFWSDDLETLRIQIKALMNDYDLAKHISQKGREIAIELWHPDKIKNDWLTFFKAEEIL